MFTNTMDSDPNNDSICGVSSFSSPDKCLEPVTLFYCIEFTSGPPNPEYYGRCAHHRPTLLNASGANVRIREVTWDEVVLAAVHDS